MNEDPYKVCPECGGEYQYTVAACVDCDVPLVFPEEISRRDAGELPLSPGLVLLRGAPILWVRALAADLARAGIPYAVDRRKARDEGLLSLYVRRQDREAAAALDAVYGPSDLPDESVKTDRAAERDVPAYKVCPQCGGEYRPEIERCADCGITLVAPAEALPAEEDLADDSDEEELYEPDLAVVPFPEPPRHELPPSDDLVCLCCGPFAYVADLSAALDDGGIGHRIDPGPYEQAFRRRRPLTRACLYLRPQDCEAADRTRRATQKADEEAAVNARACPACGVNLWRGASECPGCGLTLGVPDVICSRCGAVLINELEDCPNCGLAIGER